MIITHCLTTVFIIVHGTWAAKEIWHMPEGIFFQNIEQQCAKNEFVVPFHWTGTLSPEARYSAAQALVKVIESYPPQTKFILISHSHGGNISALASQILGKNKYRKHYIHTLINLATPIDVKRYMPDMNVVRYVFNLFSFSDRIQSIFGFFNYEYPEHKCIANLRVSLNGQAPSHSELHDPIIGTWLPKLESFLLDKNPEQSFLNNFTFRQYGIIHFIENSPPIFAYDTEREQLRKREEKKELNRIITSITRKNKTLEKTTLKEKWSTIKNHYYHYHPALLHSDQANH